MGRRTIIDYLIEGKQRGFSDEVLKDDLLDNGFDEQAIDDAFYQLHFQMNLQSRDKGKEVREGSAWGEEFDEDSSQEMPEQPSNSEKKSANVQKKKASGYNQREISQPSSKTPMVVSRVVSVIYFLFVALLLFVVVKSSIEVSDSSSSGVFSFLSSIPILGSISTAYIVSSSVLALVVASLFISLGVGLWKGSEWSRNVAIFMSLLFVFLSLPAIFGPLAPALARVIFAVIVVFNLFVAGYLWMSEDALDYFWSEGFTGVKVTSVFNFFGSGYWAIISLFLAVFLIGFGDTISSFASSVPIINDITTIGIVAVFVFALISTLLFFTGKGLWKGRKWAKTTAIVLSVVGSLLGVLGLILGAIYLASVFLLANLSVLIYLSISKDAEVYFKK